MSTEIDLLQQGLGTLLGRFPSSPETDGELDATLWDQLVDSGLERLLATEAGGGAALLPGDVLPLVRRAAAAAAAIPFAESSLAIGLLDRAGLDPGVEPATVADPFTARLAVRRQGDLLRVEGELPKVAWGARARTVVTVVEVDEARLLLAIPAAATTETFRSVLDPEPRVSLRVDVRGLESGRWCQGPQLPSPLELRSLGALVRCAGMAGALDRLLELSLEHARGREQFGRPIGRFQAVQQQLAVLAGEVAIASSAVAGLQRLDWTVDRSAEIAVAAAKIRIGRAASTAATIAHQVHGAIGFTREHELQRFTRRLWSWRDDFGDERWWADRLGRLALEAGAEGLWPVISGVA